MNDDDNVDSPADWDEIEKTKNSVSEFLKLKSGDKVRFHVLSGPLAFQQINDGKRGYTLPLNAQVAGFKLRKQYAFEILVLDGKYAGDHKVWCTGQKMAEQLDQIRIEWGSIKKCDIILTRIGEKLETKWLATPVPQTDLTQEELRSEFKLSEKIVYVTKADLDAVISGLVKT